MSEWFVRESRRAASFLPWQLVLLLHMPGCTPTATTDALGNRPTPEEEGIALAAELEGLVPDGDAVPVAVLPSTEGPAGSLLGLALDDGNRVFVLGTIAVFGDPLVTGMVIEDPAGNLVLRQDNREDGVTITLMTGDSLDFDVRTGRLRVTMTLTGSTPPSVIIADADDGGNLVINEDESIIYDLASDEYPTTRVRLPRETASRKIRPTMQASSRCPWLNGLSNSVDTLCIGWEAYTSAATENALKASCVGIQLFLDSVRGSLPFDPSNEIRSRAIAAMKIGVGALCEVASNIWRFGRIVKKLSFPVDLACLLKDLLDEVSRLTTQDGVAMDEVVCQTVFGPDPACSNTCRYANDGECDDGRPGGATAVCEPGTDCADCGRLPEPARGCGADGACNLDCPSSSLDPDCPATDICAEILYCCPNDGVCDAAYCPRGAEDDPDCAAGDDDGCEVCCPGDGICDIATCPSGLVDIDCTNADYCSRLQVCCDDDRCDAAGFDCPQPDYDCAFCGVLDDVCITGCNPIDPDCPGSGVEFGDVNGYVVDAVTGAPLPGAVVTVADSAQSTTTDATGAFVIENVPAGTNTLVASLSGYVDASVPVTVAASGVTTTNIALVPMSDEGDRVTIVLSWGGEPADLDLHLSGPTGDAFRFHAYYSNRSPTSWVMLDLDDTDAFGPETMTITALSSGLFMEGTYHVWVHNYSREPQFTVSSATVSIFAGGAQIGQYAVGAASGDPALDIWRVAEFNVAADGGVTTTAVPQTFVEGGSDSEF